MEQEFQQEVETEASTQVAESVETQRNTSLDSLPRLEDMLKSEKEVKKEIKLEGVTQVENNTLFEDKPFAQKEEKKKHLLKKRKKIVTGVFASAVALLLAFVGVNAVTLALLHKDINANTDTIKAQNETISQLENSTIPEDPSGSIEISLNVPRDYSDDQKELTILDKLTIVFRSIFG